MLQHLGLSIPLSLCLLVCIVEEVGDVGVGLCNLVLGCKELVTQHLAPPMQSIFGKLSSSR